MIGTVIFDDDCFIYFKKYSSINLIPSIMIQGLCSSNPCGVEFLVLRGVHLLIFWGKKMCWKKKSTQSRFHRAAQHIYIHMHFVPIYVEIQDRPLSHRVSRPSVSSWPLGSYPSTPHAVCAYTHTYTRTHSNPRHKEKNQTPIYPSVKNYNPHQKQMLCMSLFLLLLLASTCSPRTATSWARVPPAFLSDPNTMPRGQQRDTTLHIPLKEKQSQKFSSCSASAHTCTKPRSSRSSDKQNERRTDKQVGLLYWWYIFKQVWKTHPSAISSAVASGKQDPNAAEKVLQCSLKWKFSDIYMLLYLAYRCTAPSPIYPAQVIAMCLPVFFLKISNIDARNQTKAHKHFPCQTLARKVSTTATLKVFENRGDLSNINKCSKIRLYCSRKHTSDRSQFSVVSRRSRLRLSDQFILRPDSRKQERTVKASIPVLDIHK